MKKQAQANKTNKQNGQFSRTCIFSIKSKVSIFDFDISLSSSIYGIDEQTRSCMIQPSTPFTSGLFSCKNGRLVTSGGYVLNDFEIWFTIMGPLHCVMHRTWAGRRRAEGVWKTETHTPRHNYYAPGSNDSHF